MAPVPPAAGQYVETPDEEMKESREKQCEEILPLASVFPDSISLSCQHKLLCDGLEFTHGDERTVLENDYLTNLFLHKNDVSLSAVRPYGNSFFDPSSVWVIENKTSTDTNLTVSFNRCDDITRYDYLGLTLSSIQETGNSEVVLRDEGSGTRDTMLLGDAKYEIAKRIMGKHLSPKVQMSEFGIPPGEIRCNEGLELYTRSNGDIPVCVKPQTYERLLDRGFDLRPA